jgi:chemotaxis protein CheD
MEMPNSYSPWPRSPGTQRPTSRVPARGELQSAYLLPGELHVSGEPCQIRTILGSCVAICLWDSRERAGGMNHFLLPTSRRDQPASQRFADVATSVLLKKLSMLGCRPPNMQAKIFGGSAMFQNRNRLAVSLGTQNVAAALNLMKCAGIPVGVQETGGTRGRKIIFNTGDGVVWCQPI